MSLADAYAAREISKELHSTHSKLAPAYPTPEQKEEYETKARQLWGNFIRADRALFSEFKKYMEEVAI